jgi:hypothetical protein
MLMRQPCLITTQPFTHQLPPRTPTSTSVYLSLANNHHLTRAPSNGGGFLTDHFPNAAKAIWDFDGVYCSSRHIPGVRFAGIIHPVS